MTALIPIREHDGQQAVSGRELHAFLEVGAEYRHWFPRMVEYGFAEGDDYAVISDRVAREGRGEVERTDHAMTLDMAKELAMIQRTPRGQEARRYFIEVEKSVRAITVPQTYAEALEAAAVQARHAEALQAKVAADAPKVLFADAVSTSQTDILIGDLAKILRGNGVDVGANRLFETLRQDGYLIRRKSTDWNLPTQRSMDLGLFRIKETAITHSDGHVTIQRTTKVTGKGQQYFVDRYLSAVAS